MQGVHSQHSAGTMAEAQRVPAPRDGAVAPATSAVGRASAPAAAGARDRGAGALALTIVAKPAGTELLALVEAVRGIPEARWPVVRGTATDGATELRFAVPASLLQAELPDSLGVELVSPSGSVLYTSRIASRSLYPHRMISIRAGEPDLAEGTYRVRFLLAAQGAFAEPREYAFVLRR
jgi:hypothetical protein